VCVCVCVCVRVCVCVVCVYVCVSSMYVNIYLLFGKDADSLAAQD
jgi:hypothetical protein